MWFFKPNVERLKKKQNIKGLIKALHHEEVRGAAAKALGKIGAPAVELLIATFKDKDKYVRAYAAEALGKIGDMRAVEPLSAALKDQDWSVRKAATEALGQIGDVRVVEPLIAALTNNPWDVRKTAALALVRLYHHGALDDHAKREILVQQQRMAQPHRDLPAVCSLRHEDNWGIGVEL